MSKMDEKECDNFRIIGRCSKCGSTISPDHKCFDIEEEDD